MHSWGSWPDELFWDVGHAADYIGRWLRKWARMSVTDYKEKFGTIRVYCSFGWDTFYTAFYPGYMWIKPWWPYKLDLWISHHTPLLKWINCIVVPIQKWAYVWRYERAVRRWPHLYNEIVSMADWGELFDGKVPGYKHSNYWTTVIPEKKGKIK